MRCLCRSLRQLEKCLVFILSLFCIAEDSGRSAQVHYTHWDLVREDDVMLSEKAEAVRRQAVTDPRLSVPCNSPPPVRFHSDMVFTCMIKNIDTLLGQDTNL